MKIKVISISDQFGREEVTDLFDNVDNIHEYIHEECEDCEGKGCDNCEDGTVYLYPLISLYEIEQELWDNRYDTGYGNAHPTHWLAKHGEELCFGDYY